MNDFDWLLQPAVQDAIIALGTLGSLALWISAKVESRSNTRAIRSLRELTDGSIRALDEKLGTSLVAVEETPVAAPQIQGLNLTTRTKVLRMHRRGEQAETIAAALRLQREEVELVLKLDRLLEGSR
jgi:hypothetical protein